MGISIQCCTPQKAKVFGPVDFIREAIYGSVSIAGRNLVSGTSVKQRCTNKMYPIEIKLLCSSNIMHGNLRIAVKSGVCIVQTVGGNRSNFLLVGSIRKVHTRRSVVNDLSELYCVPVCCEGCVAAMKCSEEPWTVLKRKRVRKYRQQFVCNVRYLRPHGNCTRIS